MDQNERIAVLIPMYQRFIDDKRVHEEKQAAKLRPTPVGDQVGTDVIEEVSEDEIFGEELNQ